MGKTKCVRREERLDPRGMLRAHCLLRAEGRNLRGSGEMRLEMWGAGAHVYRFPTATVTKAAIQAAEDIRDAFSWSGG